MGLALDAGEAVAAQLEDVEARPADADLALWALESWQRATGGALKFVRAESENDALVRLYWVGPADGLPPFPPAP